MFLSGGGVSAVMLLFLPGRCVILAWCGGFCLVSLRLPGGIAVSAWSYCATQSCCSYTVMFLPDVCWFYLIVLFLPGNLSACHAVSAW